MQLNMQEPYSHSRSRLQVDIEPLLPSVHTLPLVSYGTMWSLSFAAKVAMLDSSFQRHAKFIVDVVCLRANNDTIVTKVKITPVVHLQTHIAEISCVRIYPRRQNGSCVHAATSE